MKTVRFYNVLFPLWLLLLVPATVLFLITIVGNALIDGAVLYLGTRTCHLDFKAVFKRSFLKVYLLGFLCDVVGGILLVYLSNAVPNTISYALLFNPFDHILAFVMIVLVIAGCGVLIYWVNLKISFKKLDCAMNMKKKIALYLAVLTAPYLFLLPTVWFL